MLYLSGEPDDLTLRVVESEVLIPKIMRDLAKKEKCIAEVKAFETCCADASFLMVVKCRKENTALRDCLTGWYQNEDFKKLCTEQYLKQRSEYRRTGVSTKKAR